MSPVLIVSIVSLALWVISGSLALRHYVGQVQLQHDALCDMAVFVLSPLYWVGAFFEWLGERLRP